MDTSSSETASDVGFHIDLDVAIAGKLDDTRTPTVWERPGYFAVESLRTALRHDREGGGRARRRLFAPAIRLI